MPDNGRTIMVQSFIKKKIAQLMRTFDGSPLNDWIIPKEDFKSFCKIIEQLFPSESGTTYFTEFHIENGLRCPGTGKLLNRFEYEKKKLRAKGIIKPFEKSTKNTANPKNIVITDTIKEKIDYLETHSDDLEQVKIFWQETLQHRRYLLEVEKITVQNYLLKFKALREQAGQKLIEIDFNLQHPGKEKALSDKWPTIKDHIIRLLQNAKLSATEQSFFELLPTLEEDNQNAVLLFLLPKIIPAGRIITSKKRKRKGTVETQHDNNIVEAEESSSNAESDPFLKGIKKDEYRDSYMLQIPIAIEADPTLLELREVLNKKKLTLQPLMVIIGSIFSINEIYVVVNDVWYKTESVLEAADLTFKSFFVFDCQYPQKSKNLWQFLQIAAYNIPTPSEKVGIKIRALIKEINLS
ncbi:uncharacterized protein LOC122504804 [Leptopilina heterotoma]|uniref:uncharacterized protein LOC122504804 n=1 Tax=Leptopilina heterotoma TaxID=63436 RepID=UPI001CA93BAF|nr:uncharacterized protein LOC122504804 [Leptopilina heterotoma]XP_043471996.1 uncharacterized protein LOC122504804 [Leptopilina heterotoma]XP_043471997.1 uncharacterized protein LOC122504804 [Leptopilina heterotoma]